MNELEGGPSVLIADDEDALRELLQDVLEAIGCRVEVAATSDEAIANLQFDTFDLVISDLGLPGRAGDGRQVLLAAKALPQPPAVLLITGRPADDLAHELEELRELGADDRLEKPFDLDVFMTVVERLLATGH